MKPNDFKAYNARGPVHAVQLTPGDEDDWIAADDTGRVLSTAAGEAAVRKAAPDAALYAPMLRLPGLDGKPLVFGSYVVRQPDGNFTSISRGVFEELYAVAGD
jgi:hypothetical protein